MISENEEDFLTKMKKRKMHMQMNFTRQLKNGDAIQVSIIFPLNTLTYSELVQEVTDGLNETILWGEKWEEMNETKTTKDADCGCTRSNG